jgi:hypothetical protein
MKDGSLVALVVLAVLFGVTGCDKAPPAVVAQADPWLNPPPASHPAPERVPATAYLPVAAARIAEAEDYLAAEMESQISPEELEYFAGRPVELSGIDRPFLIRGAYCSVDEFTVSIVGNALWVASLDADDDPAPVKHQPLVLTMSEVPETVYVTIGH